MRPHPLIASLLLFTGLWGPPVTAVSPGAGPSPALRLDAMEAAIRSGELKKITSVLVAQGGARVFEGYYGGTSAATHFDTRSATKAVTGMLVGIAIDQRMRPGRAPRAAARRHLTTVRT